MPSKREKKEEFYLLFALCLFIHLYWWLNGFTQVCFLVTVEDSLDIYLHLVIQNLNFNANALSNFLPLPLRLQFVSLLLPANAWFSLRCTDDSLCCDDSCVSHWSGDSLMSAKAFQCFLSSSGAAAVFWLGSSVSLFVLNSCLMVFEDLNSCNIVFLCFPVGDCISSSSWWPWLSVSSRSSVSASSVWIAAMNNSGCFILYWSVVMSCFPRQSWLMQARRAALHSLRTLCLSICPLFLYVKALCHLGVREQRSHRALKSVKNATAGFPWLVQRKDPPPPHPQGRCR